MTKYLNIIANIGTDTNSSRLEQRGIILSNKIALLMLVFTLSAMVVCFVQNMPIGGTGFLVSSFALAGVFGLNKLKMNGLSRIILSVFPPVSLLIPFISNELGPGPIFLPAIFTFIGLAVIPGILYLRRSEQWIVALLTLVHLSILVYSNLSIGFINEELFSYLGAQIVFWGVLFVLVQLLKNESRVVQSELSKTNEDLMNSNLELEKQKEEIHTQNEFLHAKQLKIEEQSANLLKSNNELRNTKVELLKMIDKLTDAQERLKKKEAEAASILNALDTHYLVAQFDLEGKLVQINRKVAKEFGTFKPDVMGIKQLQSHNFENKKEQKAGTLKSLWPKIISGKAHSLDVEIPLKEASKYYSVTLAPLFDPTGKPYRVLAIGQNITELYDQKERINTINEELKEKIFEISQQNELLNFQQQEIFAQSEEIKKQAEEIKTINESLEIRVKERTKVLEEKNQQLAEYAFINSHVLRAPLSTMMGLINLISYSALPQEDQKIYDHLLETANVLDSIVYKINTAIENGSHFDRGYLEPERDFHPMK